jgi:hypothetical protein
MKKIRIIAELIVKYLKQSLSETEKKELEEWRHKSAAHKEKLKELTDPGRLQAKIDMYRSIDVDAAWQTFRELQEASGVKFEKSEEGEEGSGIAARKIGAPRKTRLEDADCQWNPIFEVDLQLREKSRVYGSQIK